MVCFRFLDERHIPAEIALMKWNPKMDLIVLALSTGDVVLHRLVSWQKVWHIPAPKLKSNSSSGTASDGQLEKTNVVDLDWRPDGKILAIAYEHNIDKNASQEEKENQSCVVLHDVESSEMVHIIALTGKVTCLSWQEKKSLESVNNIEISKLQISDKFVLPPFIDLIPKAKEFSAKSYPRTFGSRKITEENMNDLMKVESQECLNILAIGTLQKSVQLYALGVFKIANIELIAPAAYVSLTHDLGMIDVLVKKKKSDTNESTKDDVTNYSLLNYRLDVLKERSSQILLISQIYAQCISLLYYLEETIREILEAWEDVMAEIDSKLSNYVSYHKSQRNLKGEDSRQTKVPLLADDFLELLALGNASDTLEKFLTDLTEKGLKKLGHSIELAYSNIQKLVVKNVERVCQLLYCHMNSLKGMSLWESQFGDVGLDVDSVNKALKAIGSFLLKSTECQQVIDNSMRNVKAFIRWLYTAMIRLYNNEPSAQSELTKVSQQDIQFVTEFIKENFDFDCDQSSDPTRPSESNFTLERVGQYFKDCKLTCVDSSINDLSNNAWIKFLNERPHLTSNDDSNLLLYPHNPETSLKQEHKLCDNLIRETFNKPFQVISSSIEKIGLTLQLSDLISLPSHECLIIDSTTNITSRCAYFAFIKDQTPADFFYIIKYSLNHPNCVEIASAKFYNSNLNASFDTSMQLQILDFKFYSHEIISLLLLDQSASLSYLIQLPIQLLNQGFVPVINSQIGFIPPNLINLSQTSSTSESQVNYRVLDNMKSSFIAVSGSRKVACVSFASKRRVRLFEMDNSEEEEESFNESTQELQVSTDMETDK